MIQVTNKALCSGCGACVQSCPKNCIEFERDSEGFLYPRVDVNKCINCGLCEKVCPFQSSVPDSCADPDVFCAFNKNENIRFNSSSGGVFTSLAEAVIEKKGVVFGVALTEDCKAAKHIAVESTENLPKLQGSKYFQSSSENTYTDVKKYLEQGRQVLFSGTPCQVKGLRLFLKKKYDNLLCVDIICHGVPSQKLWDKYVDYLQNKEHAELCDVRFRSKMYSWKERGKNIDRKNKVFNYNFEDPYFAMFNCSVCLRHSCYDCKAKGGTSGADITLGDFWGVEKVYPEYSDNKGFSMVLINSELGKKAFAEIVPQFTVRNEGLSYKLAKECNPAIFKSQPFSSERDTFYIDADSMDFEKLAEKYAGITPKIRIKSFLHKTGVWSVIQKARNSGVDPDYGMLLIYKDRQVTGK